MAKDHLSYSAYHWMKQCEAKQVAIDKGEWEIKPSTAMLNGQLFEALLCGQEPPEGTLKKNGEPYAWASDTIELAERMKQDKLVQAFLQGQQQVHMTIDNWVSIPDIIDNQNKRVVDIKLVRDFESRYVEEYGCRVPFYAERNYYLQLALPALELGYEAYLLAGTSESPGNFAIFHLPEANLLTALEDAKHNEKHLLAVRREEIEPTRCEKCDYCRATQKGRIIDGDITPATR